jgi:alpha-L-arabinofuranosidase
MEYLAGPAETAGGKLRAAQGQLKPWTQVFERIYIEYGNEAWNPGGHYAIGSFNGPSHWNDLITAGEASPHFSDRIVWVAGSQAGSPGVTASVLRDVPKADTYAIAPYMMNQTRARQIAHLDSDRKLFNWAFAYAIRRVIEPVGKVYKHAELTDEAGKGLSIYEHNFHLTRPDPRRGGVSYERRNYLQTSLGAGLAVINDALLMLREHGIQPQCQFNLRQRSFYQTRLWGFVPGIDIRDQRYRPHFLCEQIANDVMGGRMLKTTHSANEPTFSATGVFEDDRRKKQTYKDIPALWSYAFADGKDRGLIIFNLDVDADHQVKLALATAGAATATVKRVTGPSVSANNEPEHEPQVKISQTRLDDFRNGATLTVPAHSMTVVKWRVE